MDMNTSSSNSTSTNNDKRIEHTKKPVSKPVPHSLAAQSNNPYEAPKSDPSLDEHMEEYCHTKLFARNGRLGRIRYLVFSFCATIVMYGFIFIPIFLFGKGSDGGVLPTLSMVLVALGLIFGIGLSLYIMRRRLHDMNASSWWLLSALIPYVNLVFYLVLLFMAGNKGHNTYGAPPPPNSQAMIILVWLFVTLPILGIVVATLTS